MFELTLSHPPSTNKLRTAFVQSGKVKQVKTKEYVNWLSLAKIEALQSKRRNMPPPPYVISICVGKCNQARDLDNFAKATLDFLQEAKFIESDNLTKVHELNLVKKFGIVPDGKIEISIDYSESL